MFPQFGPGARAEEHRACLERRTQHKGTLPTTRSTTQPDRRGAAWEHSSTGQLGCGGLTPRGPAEEAEPWGAPWSGDSDDVPKATAAPRGHGRTRAPGLDVLGCGATCLWPGRKPEAPAHQGGPVWALDVLGGDSSRVVSEDVPAFTPRPPRSTARRQLGQDDRRQWGQSGKAGHQGRGQAGHCPRTLGNSCTQVTCPPSARHPPQPQQAGCEPQIRLKTTFPVASKDLGSESAG